jgi:hypothetical protein
MPYLENVPTDSNPLPFLPKPVLGHIVCIAVPNGLVDKTEPLEIHRLPIGVHKQSGERCRSGFGEPNVDW